MAARFGRPAPLLLLWAGGGFFGGCLLYSWICPAPLLLWVALAGAVLGGVLCALGGRSVGAAVLLGFFLLGLLRTGAQRALPSPEPGACTASAYVCGAVTDRGDHLCFAVRGVNLNGAPAAGDAYCTYFYDEDPVPELYDGALISFSGQVNRFEERRGAVHRNYADWARQNGYRFSLVGYGGIRVENTPQTAPVMDAAFRVRQWLEGQLTRRMGENARVVMALLFGDRSGLSEDEAEAFRTLGIAHLMSVSGLHVSLLAALLWALLRRLHVPMRACLLALAVLLVGYCVLCGFSASSLRAAVMAVLLRRARFREKGYHPFSALGAAALLILALNPAQANAPGFLLSFSAVGTIFLLYRPLCRLLWRLPRLSEGGGHSLRTRARNALARGQGRARELFALSLSAQLGVLLPTALFFHRLPTYGILVNLLIVPLTALLMPLFAVTAGLCAVPLLGAVAGLCSAAGAELLLWLVRLLSRLPYASLRVGTPCTALVLGFYAALAALFGGLCQSRRRRAAAAWLCLVVGLTVQGLSVPPALRYIQTAAGQADAALLLDGEQTVAVDVGANGTEVLDYLEAEAREVDALVITHLHLDHIGGVEALLENDIPIHHCYIPIGARAQQADTEALALLERLEAAGVPVTELAAGDVLTFGQSSLRVLWPTRGGTRSGASANVYSMACRLSFGGYSLLLAADTTDTYDRYWAEPCDVLKVPHHGAAESASERFLQIASPSVALIPCKSRARLPAESTLRRLEACGATVLRTDLCGDITLTVTDEGLTVTPYLNAEEALR